MTRERTVQLVNAIKDLGFKYATLSGATFSAGRSGNSQ